MAILPPPKTYPRKLSCGETGFVWWRARLLQIASYDGEQGKACEQAVNTFHVLRAYRHAPERVPGARCDPNRARRALGGYCDHCDRAGFRNGSGLKPHRGEPGTNSYKSSHHLDGKSHRGNGSGVAG
jgi:hypothetical protein